MIWIVSRSDIPQHSTVSVWSSISYQTKSWCFITPNAELSWPHFRYVSLLCFQVIIICCLQSAYPCICRNHSRSSTSAPMPPFSSMSMCSEECSWFGAANKILFKWVYYLASWFFWYQSGLLIVAKAIDDLKHCVSPHQNPPFRFLDNRQTQQPTRPSSNPHGSPHLCRRLVATIANVPCVHSATRFAHRESRSDRRYSNWEKVWG